MLHRPARPTVARRRFLLGGAAAVAGGLTQPILRAAPAEAAPSAPILDLRRIVFPVVGASGYTDDFGVRRSGGRLHQGIDIFGAKLQALVAAVDGRVKWMLDDTIGRTGNAVAIVDGDGWEYRYLHLNNDTPGTDDGANPPQWRFAPGVHVGAQVRAGQHVGYLGDSGNAERTPAHLHFEVRSPGNVPVNPYASLILAQGRSVGNHCQPAEAPTTANRPSVPGYWVAAADGSVYSFGDARFRGSLGGQALADVIVGVAASPTGDGYWLAGRDGGVFAFGDARFRGAAGPLPPEAAIVGIAANPTGDGYWLAGRDGGVFAFGAPFRGSLGDRRLTGPVVAIAATPTGQGYWLAAADGGVFAFGDAPYLGRISVRVRDEAVVGIAATPTGQGYWLLTADGVVAPFGDGRHLGSPHESGCGLPRFTSITTTAQPLGYWLQAADGRLWAFGGAPRHGSILDAGVVGAAPAVGLATLPVRPTVIPTAQVM